MHNVLRWGGDFRYSLLGGRGAVAFRMQCTVLLPFFCFPVPTTAAAAAATASSVTAIITTAPGNAIPVLCNLTIKRQLMQTVP